MTDRVPAVGGTRTVRAPDPVARDYLLLALRLDQHIPGLVDGYVGPAELKAQVDMEPLRAPARLGDDAAALRERLPGEVTETDRRAWLDAQLVALGTHAASLGGERLAYLDEAERCFAYRPPRYPDAVFDAAAAQIEALLPGGGPLSDRLAAWDARFEVPVDRLAGAVEWLVDRLRASAESLFGLPAGEGLRLALVRGQPWAAYAWYDGGRRSRFDLNTDLPVRATDLVDLVAHETYPGHHLEHAWKDADLVDVQGRLEASIQLINTPECLISEGLAELGNRFVAPPDERIDLLVELFDRAGLPIADDRDVAAASAATSVALAPHRTALAAIVGKAAILRHADGRSHDEVLAYLCDVGRTPRAIAEKRLEFIEHPLWRAYVFVYAEGEALLRRWLEAVPDGERVARFERLLHEQLTPAAVRAPG